MNRVRVYIATTEGPVEVQRIVEEDPDVQSVVCVDGTSRALPISPSYHAFVRKPTGVIEREFGGRAFRTDVSGPSDDGLSWQLGLFLAHALKRVGRLAERGGEADAIVWATGEMDIDLNVKAVEHVGEKLRASSDLFAAAAADGKPVFVFVPSPSQVEDAVATRLGGVEKALLELGLSKKARAKDAVVKPRPAPRFGKRWVLALLLALACGLAFSAFSFERYQTWASLLDGRQYRALSKALDGADCWSCPLTRWVFARRLNTGAVPATALALEAEALVAANGGSCRFLNGPLQKVAVRRTGTETLADVSGAGLCKVRYRLFNRHDQPLNVWFHLAQTSATATATLSPGEHLDLDLPLPRFSGPVEKRDVALWWVAAAGTSDVEAWANDARRLRGDALRAQWAAMRAVGLAVGTDGHGVERLPKKGKSRFN